MEFPEQPLTVATAELGQAAVEVRTAPEQPPLRGVTEVQLTLTAADHQRLSDVTVAVVTWMPAMGHGAPREPAVSALGDGRYLLSGVELYMPGRWELRLEFSGAIEDKAIVALDVR